MEMTKSKRVSRGGSESPRKNRVLDTTRAHPSREPDFTQMQIDQEPTTETHGFPQQDGVSDGVGPAHVPHYVAPVEISHQQMQIESQQQTSVGFEQQYPIFQPSTQGTNPSSPSPFF